MSEPELAPMGPPAEAEVPLHAGEPGRGDDAVEDGAAYELALEDGRPLPPEVVGGTEPDDDGPEFREPGV